MKKSILLFTLLVFQFVAVSAASSATTISGHVLDAATKKHLPYATVAIDGTSIGVVSDQTGHFSLEAPKAGEYTVQVSLVGYSSVESEVSLNGKKGVELTFELKEDAMLLDQVVVSASRTEITRRNSPTLVSVMPSDVFERVKAPTLADALTFNTGIRVDNNCQNCGFTQVRINGLEGNYSQVLIDSRPIFSSLTSVYGLESIPAAMVERVEVVRGGGSALFGSSAIGGTINIITKTPEYSSADIATTLSVIGDGGATDSSTTANATYVTENGKAGFTMFAQSRKRQAYDANDDGFSEIPELESKTIGLRTFFKTSDYSKLSLAYDATKDYRRGGDKIDEPLETSLVAESASHNINAGSINFDLFSRSRDRKLNLYSSLMNTERDSYYNGAGTTYDFTIATGAQFTAQLKNVIFMPSEFVLGFEHTYNKLDDRHYNYTLSATGDEGDEFQFAEEGLDVYLNTDNYYSTVQEVNTYSLFAQNEWKNEKFGFLIGARADYNDFMDKMIVSPRLNLRYNPSASVNLRASYAQGYRSPQLFDEDLHIMIVQGERSYIVNDEDLKEERSHSFNLSADTYKNFGRTSVNFLVDGFYTKLDDAFSLSDAEDDGTGSGELVQVRTNSGGAKVYGVSLEGRLTLPSVVELQAGITFQSSKYVEDEGRTKGAATNEDTATESDDLEFEDADDQRSILRSPDTYGYLSAKFPITRKFDITTTATYTGPMLVEHVFAVETDNDVEYEYTDYITSKRFLDVNLMMNYNVTVAKSVRMTLTAGVQNILNSYQSDFDEGDTRDAGFVYGPMQPRRFTLGAKLSF